MLNKQILMSAFVRVLLELRLHYHKHFVFLRRHDNAQRMLLANSLRANSIRSVVADQFNIGNEDLQVISWQFEFHFRSLQYLCLHRFQ